MKWIAVIVYETKIHFTVIPPDFARKNDLMHLDVEITPELTILNIMEKIEENMLGKRSMNEVKRDPIGSAYSNLNTVLSHEEALHRCLDV